MPEFKSFQGYVVKDETARNQIAEHNEKHNQDIENLNNSLQNLSNSYTQGKAETDQAIQNLSDQHTQDKIATDQAIQNLSNQHTQDKTATDQAIQNLSNQYTQNKTATDQAIQNLSDQHTQDKEATDQAIQNLSESLINPDGLNRIFDTVAEMAAEELLNGDHVRTLGYHSKNDGGGNDYIISGTKQSFGILLNNNLYANPIIKTILNIKQFGAYGDGLTDDTEIIQSCINYALNHDRIIFAPVGDYLVSGLTLDNRYGLSIIGEKSLNAYAKVTRFIYTGVDHCFTLKNSDSWNWNYNHYFKDFDISFQQNALGGIHLVYANESTFENIGVWAENNEVSYGFNCFSTQIVKFENCVSSHCNTAFNMNVAEGVSITKCNIYDSIDAFNIRYAIGLNIYDNWIEGFVNAFHVYNEWAVQIKNLIIKNNQLWQTLENENAKVLFLHNVNKDAAFYLNFVFEGNTCYFSVASPLAINIYFGDHSGMVLRGTLANNVFSGAQDFLYSDSVKAELIEYGNRCYKSLFASDELAQEFHGVKKPIYQFSESLYTAATATHKIAGNTIKLGDSYEFTFNGTSTGSALLALNGITVTTLEDITFFHIILRLTAIGENGQKLTMTAITDKGNSFIGSSLNIDTGSDINISLSGDITVWDSVMQSL